MKCGWAGLKRLKPHKDLSSRTSTSALGHFLPASYLCTQHRLVWSSSRHPYSFPPSPSTFPSFLLLFPLSLASGRWEVTELSLASTGDLLCHCPLLSPAPTDGNTESQREAGNLVPGLSAPGPHPSTLQCRYCPRLPSVSLRYCCALLSSQPHSHPASSPLPPSVHWDSTLPCDYCSVLTLVLDSRSSL